MNWPVIEPALRQLVIDMSELRLPGQVEWEDSPAGSSVGQYPRVLLNVSEHTTTGIPERRKFNKTSTTKGANLCVQKGFTLTIKIESEQSTPRGSARQIADRLTLRWHRAEAQQVMKDIGVSFNAIASTIEERKVDSSRKTSFIVIEILLNGVENDIDTTAPGQTIGKLIANGKLSENQITVTAQEKLNG